MGTSNQFGGAPGRSPLIPSWLPEVPGNAPVPPPPATQTQPGTPPAVPPAPTAQPTPRPGDPDRFRSPRSNLTRFGSSGGSDRRSLGRAFSAYVSGAAGGGRKAAQRMGKSRETGAGLINFLNQAQSGGLREALRTLNLEGLADRPIEEVFAGLADYICPEGGTIDEGIARDAFVETIADLADVGITDIDHLDAVQIETIFELYATHAIEARIYNDIGNKLIAVPASVQAAELVQAQLREFIQRGVSDAINSSGVRVQSLTPGLATTFVAEIYQSAFEILEELGKSEAGE
jgi:hypothetical protein